MENIDYKRFDSEDEATQWAQIHYADLFCMEHKSDEFNTIWEYTGHLYKIVNRYLRLGNDGYTKDQEECIQNKIGILDSIISKHKIPEDIIVYRYVKKDIIRKKIETKRIVSGVSFIDDGYSSTTLISRLLRDYAKRNRLDCLLIIRVHRNIHGIYVSINSEEDYLNEQEIILESGLRYEITKVVKRYPILTLECIVEKI